MWPQNLWSCLGVPWDQKALGTFCQIPVLYSRRKGGWASGGRISSLVGVWRGLRGMAQALSVPVDVSLFSGGSLGKQKKSKQNPPQIVAACRTLCFWGFLVSVFWSQTRWIDNTLWRHQHSSWYLNTVFMNMEIIKRSVFYLSDKLTFLPHVLVVISKSSLRKSSLMMYSESFIPTQPKGVKRWEQVLSYSFRNCLTVRQHSRTPEGPVPKRKEKKNKPEYSWVIWKKKKTQSRIQEKCLRHLDI